MLNSSSLVITSLIALVVSARIEAQPSKLDVVCFKTVYNSHILDATAKEACNLKSEKEGSQPDCSSCLTRIHSYKGDDFQINEPGQLLKYPLAKVSFSQKGDYHVIALWNRNDGTCRALGAVFRVDGPVAQKCNKIKYIGWGDCFVVDDNTISDGEKLARLPSISECWGF